MRKVFRRCGAPDVARGNLVLAWDFTVASAESTTGAMLHMRDHGLRGSWATATSPT